MRENALPSVYSRSLRIKEGIQEEDVIDVRGKDLKQAYEYYKKIKGGDMK